MEKIRSSCAAWKGAFVAIALMEAVGIYLIATGQIMLPSNNNCALYHIEPIVEKLS